MAFEWMQRLSQESDNKEFSQLCHDYFKLGTMRVMQAMREKYDIPPSEIPTLTIAIFARFLNDGVYAVGAHILHGMSLNEILSKEQQLMLLKVLMGEGLDQLTRSDITTELNECQWNFRKFILENAGDFYVEK